MSGYIGYLSFDISEKKSNIQYECDEWGEEYRDHAESGNYGLPRPVTFIDRVFDDYDSAQRFLEEKSGHYYEYAVKYKKYPVTEMKPSKAMQDFERRISEYYDRLKELNKAHYEGCKQKTVKCKKCGSSLATKYCGSNKGLLGIGDDKGYKNECPVCGAELRPMSILNKIYSYSEKINELKRKLEAETQKRNKDIEKINSNGVQLRWLVCCEVR
ncbi:MAG: hypothetical protein K6F27_09630 [Ruminococcus sp.]|nr:hypothetical protein [Ruminococcus sp.]